MKPSETNPVAGIFDNEDGGWHFPSAELCRQRSISPNLLAFNKASATLALVVKRSARGTDFALSEAGLLYLEATLAKGTLKDGAPVRAAFVVLAETDPRDPHQQMTLISSLSAQEMRQRVGMLGPPYPGKYGDYWWITPPATLVDDDTPF